MSASRSGAFTGAKYIVLTIAAIPVVVIVAGFVWFGTLVIAYDHKWGWLEVPVHYRLTFGVEVGGVAYTGSTVAQITYQTIPGWQVLIGPGIANLYEGQAGCVKLADGKMVCLLPNAENLVRGKYYYPGVGGIANRLLSVDGSPTGPKKESVIIFASNAASVRGSSDIPIDLLPPMIVLDDPGNPSSAHLFDPEHPERSLGPEARFLGAQIAVTNEAVSQGIETVLPWLADPTVPQVLSYPGDPFLQENPGSPLYKASFH
jgi:hypothetical protein